MILFERLLILTRIQQKHYSTTKALAILKAAMFRQFFFIFLFLLPLDSRELFPKLTNETKAWVNRHGLQERNAIFLDENRQRIDTKYSKVFQRDGFYGMRGAEFSKARILKILIPGEIQEFLGVRFKVFVPRQFEGSLQMKLRYQSTRLSYDKTYSHSRGHGLVKGQWSEVIFWLPKLDKKKGWVEVSWSGNEEIPYLFKDERVLFSNVELVGFHDISFQEALKKTRELYPSAFESAGGQTSLVIILLFLLYTYFYGRKRFLVLRIFVSLFTTVVLAFIVLLALVSSNPLITIRDALFLDLENQLVQDLKIRFGEERQRHQQVYEQTETIFQKELSDFRDQLPEFLERSRSVKAEYPNFTDNEYNSKPMYRLKPSREYPFEATLNNGSHMIHTDESIIENERFVLLAYHMYPFLLATRNSSKLDRDFQEDLLNKLSRVREFLEEGFGQFGIVSQIAYNPFRLFEIFLTDCDPTDMFLNRMTTKTFWFGYEDDRGNPWISMGKIQGHTLVEFMKRNLNSNQSLQYRYYYANSSFATALGSKNKTDDWEQAHIARQFHVEDKPWTARLIQGRFLVQEVLPSDELRGYNLSLRIDATQRFLENRQIRNQFFFFFLATILGVIFISTAWAFFITKPLMDLRRRLLQVDEGNLRVRFPETGDNQLTKLARGFNKMVYGMREKRFISQFLSRLARTSLEETQATKTNREEVSVMYCGIKNLHELQESEGAREGLETLNQCLCMIQEIIARYGGSVDKFTGSASLSLFREDARITGPLKAAREIRNQLMLWNLDREKEGLHRIKLGIGVAKGSVILGHIGSDKRKDFTIIGNTVNMAARLGSQKLQSGFDTRILFDQNSFKDFQLYKYNTFQDLGPIEIKGKTQSQNLYELE